MLGDVLEHMTKEEAVDLFKRVRDAADTVIVSIPIGHYPQDAYNGNPHEKHITDNWTDEEFKATFGEPTVGYIDKEIGVYCWSTQKVRPKICIYAISKNEEQFVARWAASGKDADLLLMEQSLLAKLMASQRTKSALLLGDLIMLATLLSPLFLGTLTYASVLIWMRSWSPDGEKK